MDEIVRDSRLVTLARSYYTGRYRYLTLSQVYLYRYIAYVHIPTMVVESPSTRADNRCNAAGGLNHSLIL
jgi:hypothetical protein